MIQIKDLHKSYKMGKNSLHVLKGINFINNATGDSYLPPDSLFVTEDIELVEQQDWLIIPLQLRFNFGTADVMPTLYIGAEYSRILSSQFTEARRGGYTASEINIDKLRNKQQLGFSVGVGVNYRPSKTTKNYVTLNAQYTRYTTMLNNADNRYSNPTLLYVVGYLDDDISLGFFQVSLGFTIANYRIVKKKRRWVR